MAREPAARRDARIHFVDIAGWRSMGVAEVGLHGWLTRHVRLDADALIGPAGEGFRVAMWALDGGRVAASPRDAADGAGRAGYGADGLSRSAPTTSRKAAPARQWCAPLRPE